MSWGLTYVLPWSRLDISAVESAIRHVLRQLPDRSRESRLEFRGPNVANWFVAVYTDEERQWTLHSRAEVDRTFGLYNITDGESIWVDIVFTHDPGDLAHGLGLRTAFHFDTAWSGNSLAPGSAVHVCELLGAYFGVPCERD